MLVQVGRGALAGEEEIVARVQTLLDTKQVTSPLRQVTSPGRPVTFPGE